MNGFCRSHSKSFDLIVAECNEKHESIDAKKVARAQANTMEFPCFDGRSVSYRLQQL